MCGSMTERDPAPLLRRIGHCHGFNLYYNPLNRRVIAERDSDLATVLFDYPSCAIVRRWDATDDEAHALRACLLALSPRLVSDTAHA